DGETVACADGLEQVLLYDRKKGISTAGLSTTRQVGQIHSLAFSRDGELAIAGAAWVTVLLYDPPRHKRRMIRPANRHLTALTCLAVAPDGKTVAGAAERHCVWIWQTKDAKPVD